MKLITEIAQDLKYMTESTEGGKKNMYIEGVYMMAEKENRNGRLYPLRVLKKAVESYQPMIDQKRALGELGHPPHPTIDLNNVSHLIEKLHFNGTDVIGRAKILETPSGQVAKSLIESGVCLGVSSRGLGSMRESRNGIMEVQDDFHLATVDIVADPSAPNAFVQGIMENAEWIMENGIWKQVQLEQAKKVIKKASKKQLEETKIKIFEHFMKTISKQ